MPAMTRIKTNYPGVYYIEGKAAGAAGKERIYYIIYRKNGKLIEERAGRRLQDAMTPAKAARMRADCLKGRRLSERKFGKEKKPGDEDTAGKPEKVATDRNLLEEKWVLFMESSTEAFSLMDSKLKLVEMNEAALRLFPEGSKKEDLLGKTLEEFAPGAKDRGDVERFLRVFETGEPLFMDEVVPPPKFGDKYLNYKVFKVGDGLGMIITDITELIRKERELRKRESDLEGTNTALKVLLKKRAEDKAELEEKMLYNLKELVVPYLEKIRNSRLDSSQKAYLDIVLSNLDDIVSPLVRTLSTQYMRLTPMEIQVANLVKLGKTTKEMAEILTVSPRTIETYRDNIRKKLGIKNEKINLRTYLSSLK